MTMIGETAFGRIWRARMFQLERP
jgi:hypothetical protein